MKFLLSNDDGYLAPGINELAHILSSVGEVVIVAPEENKSASSSSLTLKNPLTITEHKKKSTISMAHQPIVCILHCLVF